MSLLEPHSDSSSFGHMKPSQTKETRTFMYVVIAVSAVLVLFSIFQLIRIHVRLWQLRYQSRRRNFLAKRLFHAFLCFSFLVSIASSVFGLTSFCFAGTRQETWWCFPVDVMLKRLASFLSFAAYITTLLFWTEFVYCINHNAATGIGIITKGFKVVRFVRNSQPIDRKNKRTVLKLSILILICSVLLLFRSLWAMIAFPLFQYGVIGPSASLDYVLFFFGEVTPSAAMIILMFPLPSPPRKAATRQIQVEYRSIN